MWGRRRDVSGTHNELRLAVDALSGGLRAGLFARSLTIYAERAQSVRLGSNNFSRALTNSGETGGDAEKRPPVNVSDRDPGGPDEARLQTERDGRA